VAQAAGCSHNVAWRQQRTVREYIRAVMAANGSVALAHWRTAARVAARRGDHTAAMEWLMFSGILEPLPKPSRGTGSIVIVNGPSLPGMPTIDGENHTAPEGAPGRNRPT
jgi:hypothetical protein